MIKGRHNLLSKFFRRVTEPTEPVDWRDYLRPTALPVEIHTHKGPEAQLVLQRSPLLVPLLYFSLHNVASRRSHIIHFSVKLSSKTKKGFIFIKDSPSKII